MTTFAQTTQTSNPQDRYCESAPNFPANSTKKERLNLWAIMRLYQNRSGVPEKWNSVTNFAYVMSGTAVLIQGGHLDDFPILNSVAPTEIVI